MELLSLGNHVHSLFFFPHKYLHSIWKVLTSCHLCDCFVIFHIDLFIFIRPRKSSLSFPVEDDEDVEEEADEVVPDGVEEVELARVELEKKEQEQKLILDDIRKLSLRCENFGDLYPEREGEMWMIAARPMLVRN